MQTDKILSLDGWRGLAIAGVIVGHFATSRGLNFGRMGVELFFVLSGRLMAELLFVKSSHLPTFLKRRVSRVWPALYVFVLVMAGAYWAAGSGQLSAKSVISALTFTANYVGAYGYHTPVFDHLWSLCIEEHTYLFLAAVAILARRGIGQPETVCLTTAILCMANGIYQTLVLGGDYYEVYWRTDTRASSILLSCGVYLWMKRINFGSSISGSTVVAIGALGVLLNINIVPDYVKYTIGTMCFVLCVCLIDTLPKWASNTITSPWLVKLGLLSFSLYLWQQPFAKLTSQYPRLALLAAAIFCALISFYLIEQPARKFLNNTWAPNRKREILAGAKADISL